MSESPAEIKADPYGGPLAQSLTQYGMYCEAIIINTLGEDLIIINNLGHRTRIKSETLAAHCCTQRVIIRTRTLIGDGVSVRNLNLNNKATGAIGNIINIARNALESKPVHVLGLDWLLCLERHAAVAVHPHQEEPLKHYLSNLRDNIKDDLHYPPYVVHANDPTGNLKQLFMVINGKICAVKVKQLDRDKAACMIGTLTDSAGHYNYTYLDMDKIITGELEQVGSDGQTYIVGYDRKEVELRKAFRDRTTGMDHDTLAKERSEYRKVISTEYEEKMEALKRRHMLTEARLKQNAEHMANRVKELEQELVNARQLAESNADLCKTQLELNSQLRKEEAEKRKHKHEEKVAQSQETTTILKVVAVAIPVVVAIVAVIRKWWHSKDEFCFCRC